MSFSFVYIPLLEIFQTILTIFCFQLTRGREQVRTIPTFSFKYLYYSRDRVLYEDNIKSTSSYYLVRLLTNSQLSNSNINNADNSRVTVLFRFLFVSSYYFYRTNLENLEQIQISQMSKIFGSSKRHSRVPKMQQKNVLDRHRSFFS